MKPMIFLAKPIPEVGMKLLQAAGEVKTGIARGTLFPDDLATRAGGCTGMLVTPAEPISEAILQKLPTLKGISNFGVGYNHIDVAACTRRGIGVANTPDVLTAATAEVAWALILACARRVVEGDRLMRSGKWAGWEPMDFLASPVVGKTLGIVGAGRIGSCVAKMAAGFDMPIRYTARSPKPEIEMHLGARRVDLPNLLANADFVSLHVPLSTETRHLIGERELAMMKRSAFIINTARGPLIDEQALVNAVRDKRIAGCGLDVYENEPSLTPGLIDFPNVVLLPHVGSGTLETREKMAVMAADNLVAMLQGHRPPHCVNPEVYDQPRI